MNSEWQSAKQPDSFRVNFKDRVVQFSCDIFSFHFESNGDGQLEITRDLRLDKICFGAQPDGAIMKLLAGPVTVKVDPDASTTPERIYLVRDGKAIALTR